MPISRKALCFVYGLIGLLALIGTWGNNVQYMHLGVVGANVRFWQETLANPASRSITIDIFFLSVAVTIWMVLEARRLGMRGVWLYVIFALLIAVSVTFPVFMINRERALSRSEGTLSGGTLTPGDVLGLVVLAGGVLAYTVLAFVR